MESNFSLNSKRNVVKELVEKQESWVFTNTKCRVDRKIAFKWNTLFQAFKSKEFEVIIQYDPSI